MRTRWRLHSEANCIVGHVCLLTEMAAAHCQWLKTRISQLSLHLRCLSLLNRNAHWVRRSRRCRERARI